MAMIKDNAFCSVLCSLFFVLCFGLGSWVFGLWFSSLLFALCALLFALCSLLFALCSLLFALDQRSKHLIENHRTSLRQPQHLPIQLDQSRLPEPFKIVRTHFTQIISKPLSK